MQIANNTHTVAHDRRLSDRGKKKMEEAFKLIGSILGVLGFTVSCLNLYRQRRADRRSQQANINKKQEELQQLLWRQKVAVMNGRRRLKAVAHEARLADAEDVVSEMEKNIRSIDKQIAIIDVTLKDSALDFSGEKHEKVLSQLKAKIHVHINPEETEIRTDEVIDLARRSLEERKRGVGGLGHG
jgi:hypothetical protein